MVKLAYIDEDPVEDWEYCNEQLEVWKSQPNNSDLQKAMGKFRKHKAIVMIWVNQKLEGTLPLGVSEYDTFRLLGEMYEKFDHQDVKIAHDDSSNEPVDNRQSKKQFTQHMQAYLKLCSNDNLQAPLTEELIKQTHRITMQGLLTDDQREINAGEYRKIPVHADEYVFPDFECIPESMNSIVAEYNKRFKGPHDMYQLASWLLYRIVSLHPFEDGNGRLCRLLWCYSLMRDGLPFPLTISSGRSKAHKHYVKCIERSRTYRTSDHPHLTSLTVASVARTWVNFNENQSFEASNKSELEI